MTRIAAIDESRSEARPSEGRALLAELRAQYGETLPDIYAYMAHRPGALRAYSDFVLAVMGGDALPYEYKELAYLKTSIINECQY